MHIISAEKIAKIWLQPISVEYNRGYNPAELNRIVKLTEDHIETLQESWNAYFAR